MSNEGIPDMYKKLLARVENIERALSKTSGIEENIEATSDHVQDSAVEQEVDLDTERAIPVVLTSKAYLKIAVHAKKYANSKIPQKEWVEVIGLLTGSIKNENTPLEQIEVDEAWPVGHGDAVSVSILETASVAKIIENTPKGKYIVGWYHSHPSYGNFLSTDDYQTQARYQTFWNKSIAIVVDPTQISKHDQGYGVFRNSENKSKMRYTELSSEVDGMSTQASFQILELMKSAYTGSETDILDYS